MNRTLTYRAMPLWIGMLILATQAMAGDRPRPLLPATNAQPPVPTQQPLPESARPASIAASEDGRDDDAIRAEQRIAPPVPVPFQAVYRARISIGSGTTTMTLMPNGQDHFVFQSQTRARGLARMIRSEPLTECSVFSLAQDGEWQADRYAYRDGKKDADTRFNWQNKTADARYRDERRMIDIEPGVSDRLLEQLLVSRTLVAGGQPGNRQVIDRANLRTIRYEYLGAERVTVDAGSFDTLRYRRSREGSKRSSVIWFAPALNGLPVRIEQYREKKRQASVALREYATLAALQARGTVTPVCP